jgi:hypothetical protein
MVRSVGGLAEIERTTRDAAVGGSEIRTAGTGETVAWSPRSGADEAGAVGAGGAGGTFGVSQSHRRQ